MGRTHAVTSAYRKYIQALAPGHEISSDKCETLARLGLFVESCKGAGQHVELDATALAEAAGITRAGLVQVLRDDDQIARTQSACLAAETAGASPEQVEVNLRITSSQYKSKNWVVELVALRPRSQVLGCVLASDTNPVPISRLLRRLGEPPFKGRRVIVYEGSRWFGLMANPLRAAPENVEYVALGGMDDATPLPLDDPRDRRPSPKPIVELLLASAGPDAVVPVLDFATPSHIETLTRAPGRPNLAVLCRARPTEDPLHHGGPHVARTREMLASLPQLAALQARDPHIPEWLHPREPSVILPNLCLHEAFHLAAISRVKQQERRNERTVEKP